MATYKESQDTAVIDDDFLELETAGKPKSTPNKRNRNVSFPDSEIGPRNEVLSHHTTTDQQQRPRSVSTATLDSNDPRIGHFEQAEHAISSTTTLAAKPHRNSAKLSTTTSHNDGSRMSASEIHRHEALAHVRKSIGLDPQAPITDEGHDAHVELTWSSIRVMFREPFAEFFGTFIMILFGNGSVAQVLLSNSDTSTQAAAPGGQGFGAYQSINWGWALGVMLGIYVAGDSGAFLNPAITFNFCLFRNLPWRRWPIYFVAQFLGAFCASAVVYANYYNAINAFEGSSSLRTVPPGTPASAGIFCTYPQAFMTTVSSFFSEFIASAILMFVIFALKDDSNPGAMGKTGAGALFPLALFFLIFGLGACFGWETGYAINLVRDFPPRLMSYMLGYGNRVWSAGNYYFWIPMVAPFCGTVFGGFLYDLFIYTGPESPVNMPWMGVPYLVRGGYWTKKREKGQYEV